VFIPGSRGRAVTPVPSRGSTASRSSAGVSARGGFGATGHAAAGS
jgi:hypothetical protein